MIVVRTLFRVVEVREDVGVRAYLPGFGFDKIITWERLPSEVREACQVDFRFHGQVESHHGGDCPENVRLLGEWEFPFESVEQMNEHLDKVQERWDRETAERQKKMLEDKP